jgi:predicted RNA-binding Zn-ribbon protein involved in translation (DUF1610 family)
MGRKLTNEEFIGKLRVANGGVIALDAYQGSRAKIHFQCLECGHIWNAFAESVMQGYGCPVCGRRKLHIGENDLWTTRPDVAKLLAKAEDGYAYTCNANIKVDFVCPICGKLQQKFISNVTRQGFACSFCSDGISFANKMIFSIINQLHVDYMEPEWSPKWANKYRYDMYFEYNNLNYIVEMDGGVGHGNLQYNSKTPDVDGMARDAIKDELARQHNIHLIRIDCYYHEDRFEYIKNNIIQSELSSIFDLSIVNWNKCLEYCTTSLIKEAADLYNKNMLLKDIAKTLCRHCTTISRWLKQASIIGLCDYHVSSVYQRCKEISKVAGKPVEQYTKSGVFIRKYDTITAAAECVCGSQSNISACCNGKKGSAYGFCWLYAK